MPAKFRVRAVEGVPERRQYVLRGEVIEGVVHPGMTLSIALNSSLSVTEIITLVGSSPLAGRSEVEIIVQCREPGDLEVLLALKVGHGEVVDIGDA